MTDIEVRFLPIFQAYLKLGTGFDKFENYVLKDYPGSSIAPIEKHPIQRPYPVAQCAVIEVPPTGGVADPAAVDAIRGRIEEKKAIVAAGEVTEEGVKAELLEFHQKEKALKAEFDAEAERARDEYERLIQFVTGLSDDLLSISAALVRAGDFFSDDDFRTLRHGLLAAIQQKEPIDDGTMRPIRKRLDELFRQHSPA
jgi:hypothetical protein